MEKNNNKEEMDNGCTTGIPRLLWDHNSLNMPVITAMVDL